MDVEISSGTFLEGTKEENKFRAKSNRYLLSGDLIAGKISTILKIDGTMEIQRRYYHLDHLNSTKVVTDDNGEAGARYIYRAFGEELRKIGEEDAKYTYGGKELDSSSNLYYFNARYYDATLGRFINVDPAQANTNWYVYCSNNPLSFVDPTGLNKELTESQASDISNQIDENWEGNNLVDDDGVRWFDQNTFDNVLDMGSGDNNTACNLTTHMNMLSKEYTAQTGQTMGKNQLMAAFKEGYQNGDFNLKANLDKYGDNFLNHGNKALGLEGTWSISSFTESRHKGAINDIFSNQVPAISIPNMERRSYSFEKIDRELGVHFRNKDIPNIKGWKSARYDPFTGQKDYLLSGGVLNTGNYQITLNKNF